MRRNQAGTPASLHCYPHAGPFGTGPFGTGPFGAGPFGAGPFGTGPVPRRVPYGAQGS